jgi:tetratricopeptide (TPR) repeat protein
MAFGLTAGSVFILSYVGIRAWQNRPTSRRLWFWLGVASLALGLLLSSRQILADMMKGEPYTMRESLFLVLLWSGIMLAGLSLPFTLGKLFRWLFTWRSLKRCLLALAVLITLVMTFYAEENWRGKRAWENFRREWEAKGEKFELSAFAPPAVPDEQNFAMAPMVVSSYAGKMNRQESADGMTKPANGDRMAMELERTNLIFDTNVTIGRWQQAKTTDLKPWQDYYRTRFITNRWETGMPGLMMDPRMRGSPPPRYGIPPPEPMPVDTNQTEEVTALATNEFPIAAQSQSPAADVLLALSRYAPAIEELRQAAARPYSRFPLNYQIENPADVPSPHLAGLKQCAIVLQLRAIAELQAGQTEPALADVKLMLRLAESIRSEPFLMSQSVRLSIINLAMQPVWEGLAERGWSEAQLQELNRELQKLDSISDFKLCLRGELAMNLGAIEFARKHRGNDLGYFLYAVWPTTFANIDRLWRDLPALPRPLDRILETMGDSLPDEFISRCVNHLPPDGWYEHNKVALAKIYLEKLLPSAQPEKHMIDRQAILKTIASIEKARATGNVNPQNCMALMTLPTSGFAAQKVAMINNTIDLANVACALERYHLAHEEYPETLAALSPQFMETIPPDVVDGQPLHYHRTSNGRFILYSVGWNGQDDGGVVGLNAYGRLDFNTGDWVWQYPQQ